MLVESSFTGDPRVRREAFTLTNEGYKVSVIALRKRDLKAKENLNGVQIYRIPYIKLFKKGRNEKQSHIARLLYSFGSVMGYIIEYFYFTFVSLFLSFYLLIKEGFDVIHAHNPPDTLFIVGAFYRLFGKKFVFDHHDLSPELYLSRFGVNDGFIHQGLLKIEKLCLRSANMVIATNESYKEIAMKRGNKEPENIFVVRNGPDLERVKLTPPDEGLKKMNKTILGYVGALNPQDGVDYLLRAINILVYEIGREDFYCIIIGKGDALKDLMKLAHNLKIEDFVRFTGYIPDEDMLRYLSTAEICLDPDPSSPLNDQSTWIKIMEYMALGKPIISFDLKETRFSAGDAAIYVTPNDEREFAKAIVKLIDNPAERKRRGAFGQKRVREQLAWHHVSKNLILGYEHLLQKSSLMRSNLHQAHLTQSPDEKSIAN